MKIILSPAKTRNFDPSGPESVSEPRFYKEAAMISREIMTLSREDLGARMKIKGVLLEQTYGDFQGFFEAAGKAALWTYRGEVFKQLALSGYSPGVLAYLDEHLFILSALYGVLRPRDAIRPYRLDMTMRVMDRSLYQFWSDKVPEVFDPREVIVNLASREFARMVPLPMVTVHFKQKTPEGGLVEVAIHSKQARGRMLHFMAVNRVEDPAGLKKFNEARYVFEASLSDEREMVFVR
jgi:hypothetical protein